MNEDLERFLEDLNDLCTDHGVVVETATIRLTYGREDVPELKLGEDDKTVYPEW